MRVRVGHVRATCAERDTPGLVEAAHPGRDAPVLAIEPAQRVVVGITYEAAPIRGDGESLRVLKSRRVADAVHVAKVEQASADDRAHRASRGEIDLAHGTRLGVRDE